MSYQHDRAWADAYIPALRQIVGPLLLEEAPLERDAHEATDLIVFTARDMRIGCRVRRHGYASRYPWDITFRAKRDSGARTEISKIIDGWGDWLVYAHAADDPMPKLDRWFVIDLNVFRASLIRYSRLRPTEKRQVPNGDGTYHLPYDVREFPPDLIIASSHRVPRKSEENADQILDALFA